MQETNVGKKTRGVAALSRGTNYVTTVILQLLLYQTIIQQRQQPGALLLVLKALRDTDVFAPRQVHEVARRKGQVRCQPRTFAADPVLGHLYDNRLTFAH